jgi:tetratricopeptide (TPR) repeat protein
MIVADLLYNIAMFLGEMAKYEGAEIVFNKAIEYYQKASQRLNVAKVYAAIARMHNTEVSHPHLYKKKRCIEYQMDMWMTAMTFLRQEQKMLKLKKCFFKPLIFTKKRKVQMLLKLVPSLTGWECYIQILVNLLRPDKPLKERIRFVKQLMEYFNHILSLQNQIKIKFCFFLFMKLKADHLMTAEVLYSLGCVHLSERRLHVRTTMPNCYLLKNMCY